MALLPILQMSQFYTQQAYGLWPQVWPVPDVEVIKGYEKFLYRLMLIIGLIFSIAFYKRSGNRTILVAA